MYTITELINLPSTALVNPQHVVDALSLDPDVGLIETAIVPNLQTGRGITIYYGFSGFDEHGSAMFTDEETIPFAYSNHSEFVQVADLTSMRDWLIEKVGG